MVKLINVQQVSFNNKREGSLFDILSIQDLFNLKDIEHSPLDFHQVNFYILLFFTKGQGIHTIDFTDYTYHKGTILSIRKDQIHKFFKANSNGYLLLFTDDFLVSFFEKKEALKSMQLFNELITSPKIQLNDEDFREFEIIVNEINKEYFVVNDEQTMGLIRSLLNILINKIFRIKARKNNVLSNKKYLSEFATFQQLVEKNCFKTKKVIDYANMMALSTKTLNNVTNSILNKSAKRFIDDILIIQIKRLLINTKNSVKEIAYEVGFEETSNLYKFFKRHTQTTPEKFRTIHY